MENKYMKKCSTLVVNREIKIKTTMKYYQHLLEQQKSKPHRQYEMLVRMQRNSLSYFASGNVKIAQKADSFFKK